MAYSKCKKKQTLSSFFTNFDDFLQKTELKGLCYPINAASKNNGILKFYFISP